jgi:hypothetical protein
VSTKNAPALALVAPRRGSARSSPVALGLPALRTRHLRRSEAEDTRSSPCRSTRKLGSSDCSAVARSAEQPEERLRGGPSARPLRSSPLPPRPAPHRVASPASALRSLERARGPLPCPSSAPASAPDPGSPSRASPSPRIRSRPSPSGTPPDRPPALAPSAAPPAAPLPALQPRPDRTRSSPRAPLATTASTSSSVTPSTP